MKTLVIAVVALLGSVASPCALSAQEAGAKRLTACVTISGTNSHVMDATCRLITSTSQWAKLWEAHVGAKAAAQYDTYHDPLTLPVVDFDHYVVVAIFRGRVTNNAGLAVASIEEEQDHIVFRFRDKRFQSNTPMEDGDKPNELGVYGFFVIPRSKKAIIVQEDVNRELRGTPVWKELAKLQTK
jgi:hypothetical protein